MKNNVLNMGIRNTFHVIFAQIISLMIGIVRTLILPFLLGITSYGYWQIYLLYLTYAGVFAFGFNDGIYLRYGKYEYNDLPREKFRSSIRVFIFTQLIIMFLAFTLIFFETNLLKQFSVFWAILNIPIAGLTGVLTYILQITNQLRKFSFYSILDKLLILVIILFMYLFKCTDFRLVIIADTLTRLIVLLLMINTCKEIIFGIGSKIRIAITELITNVSVGIKLMLANFSGMLIIGFGRILIERNSNIEIYASYSFAFSTMNLVLALVSSIGLVIYPTLNRLEKSNYSNYYIVLNHIITIVTFGFLLCIFPLRFYISTYMTAYLDIIKYLPIIFTIIFIQAKMQIIINSFYKLLRKENEMLKANIIGLLIVIAVVTPIYYITKSITLVASGTLASMILRVYMSEIYLKSELNIVNKTNIFIEIILMTIFIICGYQLNYIKGFILYLTFYIIYFISQIKSIKAYVLYFIRR